MPYSDPEKQKEYRKAYYQKNREKILSEVKGSSAEMTEEQKEARKAYMREYHKAYNEKNKVKRSEQSKALYRANKDAYKSRSAEWRKKNPERYKELTKNHQEKNREKINARSAQWYAENKEKAAKNSRKIKLKQYGITEDMYREMLEKQGHACAICGAVHSEESALTVLRVDHCHETNSVRGLLCNKCNTGIGLLGDNLAAIMRAADYLTNS